MTTPRPSTQGLLCGTSLQDWRWKQESLNEADLTARTVSCFGAQRPPYLLHVRIVLASTCNVGTLLVRSIGSTRYQYVSCPCCPLDGALLSAPQVLLAETNSSPELILPW